MPELPEVQTTVDGINKYTKNKTIKDVWSDFHINTSHGHKNNIKNKKYFENLKKRIIGVKIKEVRRIGKNVIIDLSNKYSLIVHMKMTGHFLYEKNKKDPFNQFIHFFIEFSDDKRLSFSDMRKFASICITKTPNLNSHPGIKGLGIDALIIKEKNFIKKIRKILKKRKNLAIKTLLLDQNMVTGIGNIYSDEALFASAIHPLSNPKNITDDKLSLLIKETQKILKKSIKLGGDSMSDYRNILGEKGGFQKCHKAYRQTGKKCQNNRCTGIIERMVINGRSAHFCPIHQILYK